MVQDYDLPESEKVCPHDGTALTVMDREISERYHFQPARAWITEEVRLTYSCPCCRGYVKTAPAPYMWVRLGVLPGSEGQPERRIVIFTYCPYRNTETLQQLLEGFSGKLITDGLDLYDSYADLKRLVHGLCNAHARRGFEEARQIAEGDPKKSKSATSQPNSAAARARVALEYYRQIYRIEREIKDLSPTQKVAVRQERSAPIMAAFKSWLDELQPKVWPEGKLGKAISYALSHWDKLCTFLKHGEMDPDTNVVERLVRSFVIGRGNWVLHKSQAGATASANLYSLVMT